jgi:hypothetical protein
MSIERIVFLIIDRGAAAGPAAGSDSTPLSRQHQCGS